MAKGSEIDKAIRNIMNWADRPEWVGEKAAVFDAHLNLLCERLGISQEELGQELAEHGYGGMVFGIIFEDFFSRRIPPDGKNIIDDYLQRRSWRESVSGRRYLQQLRDSVLSLYEVVEVSPGQYCDLRDLVRGGKIVRVYEHMGTLNLVKWDRIAARVLNLNSKQRFSGGILPFPHEAAQSLLKVLTESGKQFQKELSRLLGEDDAVRIMSSERQDENFLRDAGPAFTTLWLLHTLEQLHAPMPEIVNRDGESLLFTETRFPFLAEQLTEIAQRLDNAPEWVREDPDDNAWLWLQEPEAADDEPLHGMAVETFQQGSRTIRGSLELTPGVVILTTNSLERANRGKEMLQTLLHGLIGPALSKIQTPEQLMAERESQPQHDSHPEPADALDPAMAAEIMNQALDQHYRRCLDEPVPALGNKTPRQCVRSKKGRTKVIEWLKKLENNEQRRAIAQGQAPYDSSWMWDELGLSEDHN